MSPRLSDEVLAIDADALAKMRGDEDLCGLWNVFTKCKESLHDGRRLENIAWRLWHREIFIQHTPDSIFYEDEDILDDPSINDHSALPLDPISSGSESSLSEDDSTVVDDDDDDDRYPIAPEDPSPLPSAPLASESTTNVPSTSVRQRRRSSRTQSSSSSSRPRRRALPSPRLAPTPSPSHPPLSPPADPHSLAAAHPASHPAANSVQPHPPRPVLDINHRTNSAPHRLSNRRASRNGSSPSMREINIGQIINSLLPDKVDLGLIPRSASLTRSAINPSPQETTLQLDQGGTASSVMSVNIASAHGESMSSPFTPSHSVSILATLIPSSLPTLITTQSSPVPPPTLVLTNPTPRPTPPTTPSRASSLDSAAVRGVSASSAVTQSSGLPAPSGAQNLTVPVVQLPSIVPLELVKGTAPMPSPQGASRVNSPSKTPASTAMARSPPVSRDGSFARLKRNIIPRAPPRLLASPFAQPVSSPSSSLASNNLNDLANKKIFFIEKSPPGEEGVVEEALSSGGSWGETPASKPTAIPNDTLGLALIGDVGPLTITKETAAKKASADERAVSAHEPVASIITAAPRPVPASPPNITDEIPRQADLPDIDRDGTMHATSSLQLELASSPTNTSTTSSSAQRRPPNSRSRTSLASRATSRAQVNAYESRVHSKRPPMVRKSSSASSASKKGKEKERRSTSGSRSPASTSGVISRTMVASPLGTETLTLHDHRDISSSVMMDEPTPKAAPIPSSRLGSTSASKHPQQQRPAPPIARRSSLPGRSKTSSNLVALTAIVPPAPTAPPPLQQHVTSPRRQQSSNITSTASPLKKTTSNAPPLAPSASKRRPVVEVTSSDIEDELSDEGSSADWSSTTDDDDDVSRKRKSEAEAIRTGEIAREAALEAARQRDMFRKLPSRSYSNLAQRTKSGLLSELMHPPPEVIQHLYTGYANVPPSPGNGTPGQWPRLHNSAQNLGPRPPPLAPLGALQPMTAFVAPAPPVQSPRPRAAAQHRPSPASRLLKPSKSAAEVRVEPVSVTNQVAVNLSGRPGYRPKGRPAEAEIEMETDDDDEDNSAIQDGGISKSVAQRRLEELAARRQGKQPAHNSAENTRAHHAEAFPPTYGDIPQTHHSDQVQYAHMQHPSLQQSYFDMAPPERSQSMSIPVPHPWNFPPPPPPQTPRTTRRTMMAAEMSESLRRNLLWDRKTSRQALGLTRREKEEREAARAAAAGLPQLSPKERQRRAEEEETRAKLLRSKSWANDYHHTGW